MQRQSLAQRLQGVEGWLDLDEAWELHEAARTYGGSSDFLAVEIGSWHGRSTIAIGSGLRARGGGSVTSIDPHQGATPYHVSHYGRTNTYAVFTENIKRAGLDGIVRPLRMTSAAAAQSIAARSVDLLFIDGSHEYRDVKNDIVSYSEKLRDTALVAINDPSVPGVYRALREAVLKSGSAFRRPRLIENTLFFDYDRNAVWTVGDARILRRLRWILAIRNAASVLRPYAPAWAVAAVRRMYDALLGCPRTSLTK